VNFERVCLKMLCSFDLVKICEGLHKATKSWKAKFMCTLSQIKQIKHLNSANTVIAYCFLPFTCRCTLFLPVLLIFFSSASFFSTSFLTTNKEKSDIKDKCLEVGNTHYLYVLHDIWLPNFSNEILLLYYPVNSKFNTGLKIIVSYVTFSYIFRSMISKTPI